ncbi:MAG: DUF2225 domain-containing protein [Oscillospiraceae bacterium]|nr:DUF2225 domain-containing protein [Oscillospiraceae bacterium]
MKIYQPGEVLFLQGASGDCMYIVTKGKFGVYINSFTDFPAKVAEIPVGAYLGEMAVIDGSPRSATIISEEQGMAVAIGSEHFKDLLNDNPDIAVKILETLSGRYESTAKLAAEKGNEVAELPEELKAPEKQPPETYYDSMIYLAGRVRELNELLNPQKKQEAIEIKKDVNAVKLLPNGHARIEGVDKYDNTKLLANYDCVCPYCGKGFKGKTPIFQRLEQNCVTEDFRTKFSNFDISMYNNIVCPNCNYCDFYQEFLKSCKPCRVPKVEGNQFTNDEGFVGFGDDFKHTYDEAILSYYLNVECLKLTPGTEFRIAKSWHRLYFVYCDLGEKTWSDYAASQALHYFNIYLQNDGENMKTDEYMTLNMLMAELNRELGKKEEAMACYEKNTNISGYQTHDLAVVSTRRFRELRDS